jgi:hypothetical protein
MSGQNVERYAVLASSGSVALPARQCSAPSLWPAEHNDGSIKRPHSVTCGERGDVTALRPPDRKFGEWFTKAIFSCINVHTHTINSVFPKTILHFVCLAHSLMIGRLNLETWRCDKFNWLLHCLGTASARSGSCVNWERPSRIQTVLSQLNGQIKNRRIFRRHSNYKSFLKLCINTQTIRHGPNHTSSLKLYVTAQTTRHGPNHTSSLKLYVTAQTTRHGPNHTSSPKLHVAAQTTRHGPNHTSSLKLHVAAQTIHHLSNYTSQPKLHFTTPTSLQRRKFTLPLELYVTIQTKRHHLKYTSLLKPNVTSQNTSLHSNFATSLKLYVYVQTVLYYSNFTSPLNRNH